MTKNKTVLITGSAGFIGSHLAARYLKEGCRVIGVDNFCTAGDFGKKFIDENKKAGTNKFLFVRKDVIQPWAWLETISSDWITELDLIVHLASPASPQHFQRLNMETIWANTVGLNNCIKAAKMTKARVVFASTSEVYGDPLVHPQTEKYWGNVNSIGIRSCYNESKRLGESILVNQNKIDGSNHGIIRIFNTYGPGMDVRDGRVIINLFVDALTKKKLHIHGTGQQTRSFCFIEDMIEGIYRFCSKDLRGPINLGTPEEVTICTLVQKIQMLLAVKLDIEFLPLPEDDPQRRCPDIALAKQHLDGWQPKVNLDEGLKRLLTWLQSFTLESGS